MKAAALSITKLYDTLNKAYVVPSYQRPFAWNTNKATELLDAILEDATANAKLTSLGTLLFCDVPNTGSSHPFGNNAGNTIAPSSVWEVVDGQQRLTVFALIGYALQKKFDALALVYSPPLEFEMLYATSRTKKGKAVPVLIRDGDNYDSGYSSDLANLLDAFAGNQLMPPGVGSRLLETQEAVFAWVDTELNVGNFASFADYFLTKCTVVQVEADDQDSAFMMFEPLNSTSEPLTAFEVYRSKAVRALNSTFAKTELLLDYENAGRDEVIGKSNTLIFTLAQAYSGERPRIHFVPLKNYLDNHVDTAFVSQFEHAADFYREIWLQQTAVDVWFDEETKNCVRFLKAVQHDAVIPLILRYYLTNKTDLPAVLKIVVAFYALWRAAFPTNNLPAIYRALFTNGAPADMSISSGSPVKTVQQLATHFKSALVTKLGTLPTGMNTVDLWISKADLLNYDQNKLCRLYIFVDMVASIKCNLVPDDPWTSVDDVEHIHSSALAPVPGNVNRLGNLTFLPLSVNRSIQNAPWSDKKEVYGHLASPTKVTATAYSSGAPIPAAVRTYLSDPKSISLGHLSTLIVNPNWGSAEINTRTMQMMTSAWTTLHDSWLTP